MSRDAAVSEPVVHMDRPYFSDQPIFDVEMERIFAKSWLFVAHESELPNEGDYVVRPMGLDSVIVSRDPSGEFNVMLNSCMHRGNVLCRTGSGNAGLFRCGYHGWTYSNDGALLGVPHQKTGYSKDFRKDDLHLPRARVETVHGMVFATWDLDGPTLDEYLGDIKWYLDAMLGVSKAGIEVYGSVHRFVHRGNWKLAQENGGGDGYHLEWTHRTAFELDLFGPQAMASTGHCVQTPQGHTLRVQQPIREDDAETPYWGYPEERWPEISANLGPDRESFFGGSSVVHGGVFPSCIFIHVAPPHGLDDEDTQTAFFQWRMHVPVDAHTTEEWYWLFVPADYPTAWKDSSYKLMHRQHGAGAFFDSDDLENFRRIDESTRGARSRAEPFDFQLGLNVDAAHDRPAWPGNVIAEDLSEVNQRAFYGRYLELMGAT